MSLDASIAGRQTQVHELRYDWQTLALYALGIGAGEGELPYLYERFGPRVFPTFAVVPAYPVMTEVLAMSGAPLDRLVHGSQSVWMRRPPPPSGVLHTTGTVTGVFDLKRMAQLVLRTESRLDGELVFESESGLLFLGEGGFGGDRPPKRKEPRFDTKREPDHQLREDIPPQQALIYRLSGDHNPLHVDREFAVRVGFERGPILHGLATFGYCARALTLTALGGKAERIRAFHASFRAPVWPGECLETRLQREPDGDRSGREDADRLERYALQAFAGERPQAVLTGWAEVASV